MLPDRHAEPVWSVQWDGVTVLSGATYLAASAKHVTGPNDSRIVPPAPAPAPHVTCAVCTEPIEPGDVECWVCDTPIPTLAPDAVRQWWRDYPGDARKATPPPGACTGRIHRDGDPSTPCVLPAGHGDACEDPEGYTA